MANEEPVHRADPDWGTALDQPRLDLDQGHVSLLGDQLPDEAAMRLDLAGMSVAAAGLGQGLTMVQCTSPPADRARHADPKAGSSRPTAQPAINRCNNTVPKIL